MMDDGQEKDADERGRKRKKERKTGSLGNYDKDCDPSGTVQYCMLF